MKAKIKLLALAGLLLGGSASAVGIETFGLDHAGITVPSLNQAVGFFRDTFGCVPVTTIGPYVLPSSRTADGKREVPPRAKSVTLQMIRCGHGSNIELFEYKDSKGKTEWPVQEDLAAHHLAFSVKDVRAGVAYLKSKGLTIVGEPMTMTSGDTAGETWVHFVAPWGLEMELVESLHGKGYEKNHPAVKLWSPRTPAE